MDTKKYEKDKEILKEAFDKMMKSDEKMYLMKYDEKELGYGPIKSLGETTFKLQEVENADIWQFVCEYVVTEINPRPEIEFLNMRFSGDNYKNANILVNDKIQIIVSNMFHEYDEWVENLEENYNAKIKKKIMGNNRLK